MGRLLMLIIMKFKDNVFQTLINWKFELNCLLKLQRKQLKLVGTLTVS